MVDSKLSEELKPKFCPRCHKQVLPPDFLSLEHATFKDIRIGCNNCGKGIVEFFSSKKK